jgi:tripartite-type tricarboxylate transporter receptor subunit TctC
MNDTAPALSRRRLLGHTAALLAGGPLALASAATQAADKPPLRILVGFPAGGGTDAIARTLADRLGAELGQTVVVENKAGAGGQLAAQALKAAAPDGNTLFLSHDHSISILPLVVKNLGYEPARDFVPVAGFATFVNALAVSPGNPARSVDDFVAGVRAQGGKGSVGIPAPASVPEFLVKVLGERFKLDLVPVPYRGSAPMIGDMLGNQIPAGTGTVADFIDQHRAGKLRVIAVLGSSRQAALPEVPTLAELGIKGFEALPYYGFFAPAGTPKASLDAFGSALNRVLAQPAVRDRLTALGLTVEAQTAAQLGAREQAYSQTWARIIQASGFQPQ